MPSFQIASPAAEVDAADHDFAVACGYQRVHLANDLRQRQRPAVAADARNHAERAAVVASVLHFEVGAGAIIFVSAGGIEHGGGEQFGVGEDVGDEEAGFGLWSEPALSEVEGASGVRLARGTKAIPSAAEAAPELIGSIAALEALRHPNPKESAKQFRRVDVCGSCRSRRLRRAGQRFPGERAGRSIR